MSDERRFGRYGHFWHPHHFPMWKNGVFSGLDVHEPQDTTLVSDLPRHIRETRRALTAIKVLHVNFEAGVERGDLVFPDQVTDTWLRAHSDVAERQQFFGIAFPEDRAVVVSDLVLCPDWNWEPGRALYLSDLYGKMSYVERGTLAGYAITKHLVMLNIFGQHTASMISDFENWLLNQKIEITNMYNQIVQMYGDIQAIYNDIKRISDKVYLESGVYNVRAATVMNTMIPSGSIVTLPAYYYPKRNTLYLAYESNVCVPSDVGIDALYTYSALVRKRV